MKPAAYWVKQFGNHRELSEAFVRLIQEDAQFNPAIIREKIKEVADACSKACYRGDAEKAREYALEYQELLNQLKHRK